MLVSSANNINSSSLEQAGRSFLIVGSKFTIFALFYLVFEGNFPSTAPGALIFEGEI